MNNLIINCEQETNRIIKFIKTTLANAGFNKIVIGVSGGIDSATVLSLCVKAMGVENVFALMMPNGEINKEDKSNTDKLFKLLGLPEKNKIVIDIKQIVESIKVASFALKNIQLSFRPSEARAGIYINNLIDSRLPLQGKRGNDSVKIKDENIRMGNVMARVRMIVLYDFAKANSCLVGGTENKSEYLLGYYTRFGDEASDLEPIRHLYKTQVYQLAKYLGISEKIIKKKPTAGLWEGQTDETELGFTYTEADGILYQVFDKNEGWDIIKLKVNEETINKIRIRVLGNWFKKETPYFLK